MQKKDNLDQIVYQKITEKDAETLARASLDLKLAAALVARLRGPEGCPWDKEQTHLTLRPYLIEEAYEVLEVIDQEKIDPVKFKEELGDLLLQILLHSELARERGEFDIGDVARALVSKLVYRHPHVFADTKVADADGVVSNWEKLKKKESPEKKSVLDGLPKNLPSLQRAARIGEKAKGVGFDWSDWKGSMEKVDEELVEIKDAIASKNQEHIEEEIGDMFFALCNLSRHLKIQPEDAHRKAIMKFETRFRKLEKVCEERGVEMSKASLETLDKIWDEVKR